MTTKKKTSTSDVMARIKATQSGPPTVTRQIEGQLSLVPRSREELRPKGRPIGMRRVVSDVPHELRNKVVHQLAGTDVSLATLINALLDMWANGRIDPMPDLVDYELQRREAIKQAAINNSARID